MTHSSNLYINIGSVVDSNFTLHILLLLCAAFCDTDCSSGAFKFGLGLLQMFFHPGGVGEDRFELLALKKLPTLYWQQAQELSPFEVSDHQWHRSMVSMVSSLSLVCYRSQAFSNMQRLLLRGYPKDLNVCWCRPPLKQLLDRLPFSFFQDTNDPRWRCNLKMIQWMEKLKFF